MTDTNFKVNLNDLKNIFTARSSTDSKLTYNTGFLSNGQDLTELFLFHFEIVCISLCT